MLDNYSNYPKDSKDPTFQSKLDTCVNESHNLLADLLLEMGKSLNYNFDKVYLKRNVYAPKGHADIIYEQEIIRRSLVGVFLNQLAIPIRIVESKSGEEKREDNKKA